MEWCAEAGCAPLPAPPTAVAAYLASLAGLYSRAALDRRLAAIGQQHRLRGLAWAAGDPAIRTTLQGIARQHGSRRRQAAALTSTELKKLVAACGGDTAGLRDRALLLVGFAGAFGGPSWSGSTASTCASPRPGCGSCCPPRRPTRRARASSSASAAASGGKPARCARSRLGWRPPAASSARCSARSTAGATIEHARLGGDAVRDILLSRAKAAKLTVHGSERLSPHGLRAGFVTEAYMAGARDEQVMDHTRHRDLKTMRGYVRRAKLVIDSATKLLDL